MRGRDLKDLELTEATFPVGGLRLGLFLYAFQLACSQCVQTDSFLIPTGSSCISPRA